MADLSVLTAVCLVMASVFTMFKKSLSGEKQSVSDTENNQASGDSDAEEKELITSTAAADSPKAQRPGKDKQNAK